MTAALSLVHQTDRPLDHWLVGEESILASWSWSSHVLVHWSTDWFCLVPGLFTQLWRPQLFL